MIAKTLPLLALAPALALPLPAQDESKPLSPAQKLWALGMEKFRKAKASPKPKVREQLFLDVVALFRQLAKEHPKSHLYGMAQYNVGVILSSNLEGHDQEAIRAFQVLIASHVNDKDETGSIMTPFRNYRYFAWSRITGCELRLKRPGKALQSLYDMRQAFVSHCGTCMKNMEDGFSQRAKVLCLDVVRPKPEAKPAPKAALRPTSKPLSKPQSKATSKATSQQIREAEKARRDADKKLVAAAWSARWDEGAAAVLLEIAEELERARRIEDAKRLANLVLRDLPGSDEAGGARRLLRRSRTKR